MPYADRLRALLDEPGLVTMPCCFDALSARLIDLAGFPLTFMSGFGASAARIGAPDLGLMSYGEVVDQGRDICAAVSIPVIGDGDTGYGSVMNVKRTVRGFAQAGFAAVMIEDQLAPKRCGHTQGKETVDREEAFDRIRAAVAARDELVREGGLDILILARTDTRETLGLDEALYRAASFHQLGADILFVEAPRSAQEMRVICEASEGPAMANMVEGGKTPLLPPEQLQALGFKIAAYPLTLLSAAMKAMQEALRDLQAGRDTSPRLLPFADVRRTLGFDSYYEEAARYRSACRAQR